MPDSNISAEMQAAVGTETGRAVSFPVSESDIRRWAIAVYYPDEAPREFWDAEYAAKTQFGGIVAPQEFNPFAWMAASEVKSDVVVEDNDPNRTEVSMGIKGPDLKFQLNGGMEVEYGVPMRPGDVITSVSSLAGYSEREGRLGLMLFTVNQNSWTNQNGELVKTTRSTLIRY